MKDTEVTQGRCHVNFSAHDWSSVNHSTIVGNLLFSFCELMYKSSSQIINDCFFLTLFNDCFLCHK